MAKNNNKIKNIFVNFVATFAYIGYLPVFPGTWASIFTLPIAFYFMQADYFLNYLYLIYFFLIIGIWVSTEYDKLYKTEDASQIVIDEFVGQLIALLPIFFYAKTNLLFYFLGLVLFRLFDIGKFFGINRTQKLPAGFGVMLDDVLAGIYSSIILWVIIWQAS